MGGHLTTFSSQKASPNGKDFGAGSAGQPPISAKEMYETEGWPAGSQSVFPYSPTIQPGFLKSNSKKFPPIDEEDTKL